MPLPVVVFPPRRWGACALGAALALGGCAQPGPVHTPLPALDAAAAGLQDAPEDTAQDLPAPDWWKTLGDAQLDALLEAALRDNPGLAASAARLARAAALAQAVGTAADVHAQLGANATRQHFTARGAVPPPLAGSTRNVGEVQLGLQWEPDFFGRHGADLAAALGQARAAHAEHAAAAHQLAAQVARSYVALARLLAQHAVAQRTLAQRQALLQLSQQRTRAGLDSQVELTQAQAALPEARTQIEMLQEQITLARRTIAVLCGQAPQAQQALAPRLEDLALPAVAQHLGADLLARRADVVAARWRVQAAVHQTDAARADFYPNINLSAFVGLNAIGFNRVLQAGSRQLGVAPALRLPLFDGTRLRAQLRASQAELDAAIAQYNSAVLNAAREAGDAIASLQSLALQQQLQAESLAKAERVYDLAVQRYRAGLSSQLTVLNAETLLIAQRRLAVDLRARALDVRIALMHALGGGWEDAQEEAGAAVHP